LAWFIKKKILKKNEKKPVCQTLKQREIEKDALECVPKPEISTF